MRNTLTIALKETRIYFTMPVAYIVAIVFVGLTGYFFVDSINVSYPKAEVSPYLFRCTLLLVLLAPTLTMRLMAEEQKLGTFELLLTSPVRDWEVVAGKFLASMAFFSATLVLTFYYVLLLTWFGSPDAGPVFVGYLGLLLHGAAALSIGLLASSFTSNQVVAAAVGFGILLLLYTIGELAQVLGGISANLVSWISMTNHFDDFLRGVIDTGDLIYYLSIVVFALFLSTRLLESRRW